MRAPQSLVSLATALAFLAQSTGLAYAAPPSFDVQVEPSAPPPPPKVQSGGDTIYLKDGGMLRGTLIEMLPNDHATMALATGQNAVVAWGNIDRIEAAQGPHVPVASPHPRKKKPRLDFAVLVHVEGDDGVVLESLAPGSFVWAPACTGPCDAELPLSHLYRVGGENIRHSIPFRLAANPGQRVVIHVSVASRGGFAAGAVLSSVGTAALITGLIVLVVGAVGECTATDGYGDCVASTPNTGLETTGVVITVAGVGLIIGGAVLLAANARTREAQTVSAFEPPRHPETAWLRAPMWRDTVRDSEGPPKGVAFPLFTQRF